MSPINKISFVQKIRAKRNKPIQEQCNTPQPSAPDEGRTNIADVSAAALASASYKPKLSPEEVKKQLKELIRCYPDLRYNIPKDILEKFDYENAREHLDNIGFLASNYSDFGYDNAFKEGYFYSKDGAEAFKILKNRYSAKGENGYRSNLDIAFDYLSPKDVLKAKKENLFDATETPMDKFNEVYFIKDVLKLNDEELSRLKESGLLKKGVPYASENEDINRVFSTPDYKTDLKKLKLLENLIYKNSDNNDEIKDICNKLIDLENKIFIKKIIGNSFDKNRDKLNIKFIANNIDELYDFIHSKIKDYEDNPFRGGFCNLIPKLNDMNVETFKNLACVKGINQHLLERTTDYLYSQENCNFVQNIIDKINAGEEELIGLPAYKYAQVNQRVNSARNTEIQEFEENTSDEEISKKTKNGEVYAIGDNVYINEKGSKTLLGLDKKTYKKLFPPFKSLCVRQGDTTGDCYFLSGGLIAFWKNDKAKAAMLKTFSMDGDDVIITIPGYKKYPVRFPNGNIKLGEKHADTSLGNLMLEQAYAKAKYCAKNKIINTAFANADKAMDFIYGGYEGDVYKEFLETNSVKSYVNNDYKTYISDNKLRNYMHFVKQNQMYDVLDKYSDSDNYILSAGTKPREEGMMSEYGIYSKHAYAIENIDKENRTVTVINPCNSLYNATISYEDFAEHFSSISVCEV